MKFFEKIGEAKILEIVEYGSAVLVSDPVCASEQPGKRIRDRRRALGLSRDDLARRTRIGTEEISTLEDGSARLPVRTLVKICSALSIDEYKIGLEDISPKNQELGVRFRQLQDDINIARTNRTKSSTLSLLEDAWVISKQNELRRSLGHECQLQLAFKPNSDYGFYNNPAWRIGYELASETREILGIRPDVPIENLRLLIEERLQIPLIQDKLPGHIAGATVQSGGDRGIVINVNGRLFNTWSGRLTIAHELGHLLWDPDDSLDLLVVDTDERLDEPPWEADTYVEQRANAFAIEFLFPQMAIRKRFQDRSHPPEDIFGFMVEFGVSFTAARFHIWNSMHRIWNRDEMRTSSIEPTETLIG